MADNPTPPITLRQADPARDPMYPEKALDSEIVVDLSGWRMRDYTAWQGVAQAGSFEGMHAMMADIVKRWPFAYAGEPSNPESFDNLYPKDWKRVAEAIGKATEVAFR